MVYMCEDTLQTCTYVVELTWTIYKCLHCDIWDCESLCAPFGVHQPLCTCTLFPLSLGEIFHTRTRFFCVEGIKGVKAIHLYRPLQGNLYIHQSITKRLGHKFHYFFCTTLITFFFSQRNTFTSQISQNHPFFFLLFIKLQWNNPTSFLEHSFAKIMSKRANNESFWTQVFYGGLEFKVKVSC